MKTLAILFCLVASSPLFASRVDTKAFFDGLKGSYKIVSVYGEPAHAGNDVATVEFDSGQYIFTFPFCPPGGGCDPGYIFFDVGPTKIDLTGTTYTIATTDNGVPTKYTWQTAPGGKITFVNPQYRMPNGSVVSLPYVVTRAADED